jgi:hypothetical protein
VGEPATSKTENTTANSDLTRQYAFYEKNAGTGEITEADIEPENEKNQDSTWLVATYGYDNWGNLSGTTYSGWNIAQRTSSVLYDAMANFPTWSPMPFRNPKPRPSVRTGVKLPSWST